MHQHHEHNQDEQPAVGPGLGRRRRPYGHPHRVGIDVRAPFFNLALAKYGQQYPTVAVSYSAVGSSAGIATFSVRQVDFGASDVPMTPTEQAAARGVPSFRRRSTWVARASPTT